jgi:hypothetical protein
MGALVPLSLVPPADDVSARFGRVMAGGIARGAAADQFMERGGESVVIPDPDPRPDANGKHEGGQGLGACFHLGA